MSQWRIEAVDAWETLDSRGRPTVACEVTLAGGHTATATVPSGASTGTHEAHELRDGGERYGGYGVRRAVAAVRGPLAEAVTGMDAAEQITLDAALRAADDTPNLGRLGGNAVLSVSIAACLAAARAAGMPLYRWLARGDEPLLPMPMVNIISGGAHAGGAVDIQDYLVVPLGATSFSQAIEWAARVRKATAEAAERRGHASALVADEGGLAFPLASNLAALELLVEGIERAGLEPGRDAGVAIDVAASQFHDPATGRYELAAEGRSLGADELVTELVSWAERYPVVSLEDPLGEDDWEGWATITERLGSHVQLLGDDLLVTHPERLQRAVDQSVANAVLIKPNQVGTLTDAGRVVAIAQDAGYATVVSARSGETEDAWLADLAVGWRAGQIKVGSTMRSERTAKWNRLLRIEHDLGDEAVFAGRTALAADKGR